MDKSIFTGPVALGDRAIVIRLGESIDAASFRHVQALLRHFDEFPSPAVVECVPAFTTITIYYDPLRATFAEICSYIDSALASVDTSQSTPARTMEIPVCYGGSFGSDLEFVSQQLGLTPEEVIEIHSSVDYLVHMLGFAPGFPYLGGLPERIVMPRRATPRLKVPAGSVGLAGSQTGIYPIATPGGWQLIGRTPRALFRPAEKPPTLLAAGDTVRFRPISAQEFHERCEYE